MSFERTLEYKGKTKRIKEWSRELGIPYKLLIYRLDAGWTVEEALNKPRRKWEINEKSGKNPEEKKTSGHRNVFLDTDEGDYGKF